MMMIMIMMMMISQHFSRESAKGDFLDAVMVDIYHELHARQDVCCRSPPSNTVHQIGLI